MPLTRKAYRAAILHSIADPAEVGIEASYEYFEDGLLVVCLLYTSDAADE